MTHVGGRSGYNKQGEINFVYWYTNEKKEGDTNKKMEDFLTTMEAYKRATR